MQKISIKHWHVGFGAGRTVSHEVVFSTREESIAQYIDLCMQFFPKYMADFGRVKAEAAINEYADENEAEFSFCATQAPWSIVWAPCDGCRNSSLN